MAEPLRAEVFLQQLRLPFRPLLLLVEVDDQLDQLAWQLAVLRQQRGLDGSRLVELVLERGELVLPLLPLVLPLGDDQRLLLLQVERELLEARGGQGGGKGRPVSVGAPELVAPARDARAPQRLRQLLPLALLETHVRPLRPASEL